MATRSRRTKRKKPVRRVKSAGKQGASSSAQRVEKLEEMVSTLLQAALRGRLLPSERKPIKEFLQSRKKETQKQTKKTSQKRCPACRSPLSNPRVSRCPWCSVLLSQAGPGRKGKR